MKLITQVFAIMLLIAAGFTSACAQRGKHDMDPQKRAEHMTARMTEQLSLTEKQQEEVKQINLSFGEKMKTLKAQEPGEKHRSEMKALRDEHEAALAKVLTKEQLEKWEAFRAERKKGDERAAGRHREKQAAHSELRSYREKNIRPVMAEQRQKLEAKISNADKTQIASLREKLEASRKETKNQRGRKPGNLEGKKDKPFKGGHFGIRSLLEDETTRNQAEKLVEKYSTDIDALFAEISPQGEKWEQEMKAIRDKHFSGEDKKMHGRHRKSKPENAERAERKEFHRKLHFLLMRMEPKAQSGKAKGERKVNVFPNPASGNIQQLEFEVLHAGKVVVEIVDGRGKVVKTVFNGDLPAGTKKLEVNTSDLKGKMFYYRITDGQGTTSTKFLVQKD